MLSGEMKRIIHVILLSPCGFPKVPTGRCQRLPVKGIERKNCPLGIAPFSDKPLHFRGSDLNFDALCPDPQTFTAFVVHIPPFHDLNVISHLQSPIRSHSILAICLLTPHRKWA